MRYWPQALPVVEIPVNVVEKDPSPPVRRSIEEMVRYLVLFAREPGRQAREKGFCKRGAGDFFAHLDPVGDQSPISLRGPPAWV